MRSSPCLLVALVLLGAVFAGCLGGKSNEPSAPPATMNTSALNATSNSTPVKNDGTDNMTMTMGDMPHIHDYWMGRERVTLLDADVDVSQNGVFFYTFNNLARSTPAVGGVQVNLPDGNTVYEGTGKLEFTTTWTDPTFVGGMGVAYRDASTTTFSATKDVKSGVPVAIQVTPAMTDMPHSKTSRWSFLLEPDQAGQVIYGKLHVKVDIIKMHDITLWPGHSHLFNGAHTLELYKGSASSSDTFFATQIVDAVAHQQGQDTTVPFKNAVPMEAMSMTANITIKTVSVDIGKATNMTLGVKPANSNRFYPAHLVSYDAGTNTYRYAWLVDMPMTDSPYAKESAWRFDVQVDTDPSGGTFHGQCGGCSNAKVDYDAVILAYDSAVEGAAKLVSNGPRGN